MKKNSIKSLRDKYKADIKKQDNYRKKQMLKNEKIMEEQFKEFETKDINIVNEEIEPDNKVIEKVILKDSYTLFF
tara:strand:- start:228 stop:452 length:225 start_codon:yes stop_codon:yes gene_type:complete